MELVSILGGELAGAVEILGLADDAVSDRGGGRVSSPQVSKGSVLPIGCFAVSDGSRLVIGNYRD